MPCCGVKWSTVGRTAAIAAVDQSRAVSIVYQEEEEKEGEVADVYMYTASKQ